MASSGVTKTLKKKAESAASVSRVLSAICTVAGTIGLVLQRRLVSERRRIHQLSLHPQPPRRPRPRLQPRRIRRGLHQLPLDPRTGRHLGHLRHPPGARRPLAFGRLHRGDDCSHVVVGRAPTFAAQPVAGRLDGAGPAVQQRDLCGVDLWRRAGNAAVHLFRRHGGGLPEREPKPALGPAGRVAEPGRGRPDTPGGADAGGLLLRLVRRPAHGQGLAKGNLFKPGLER